MRILSSQPQHSGWLGKYKAQNWPPAEWWGGLGVSRAPRRVPQHHWAVMLTMRLGVPNVAPKAALTLVGKGGYVLNLRKLNLQILHVQHRAIAGRLSPGKRDFQRWKTAIYPKNWPRVNPAGAHCGFKICDVDVIGHEALPRQLAQVGIPERVLARLVSQTPHISGCNKRNGEATRHRTLRRPSPARAAKA